MSIEKEHIRNRFTKALSSYDDHAFAQQQIHARLIDLLQQTGRNVFPRVLEIGCGTGGFTRNLAAYCHTDEWVLNDLCCDDSPVRHYLPHARVCYIQGDAEQTHFEGMFDLVASASCIQWFTDPEAFICRISALLRPGGMLLLNTFGRCNLQEIKAVAGKGLSYPDLAHIRQWIPRDMELCVLKEEEIVLYFHTPLLVLKHLKYTGVTATASECWTPGKLQHFCSEYNRLYTEGTNVKLTYQPVYLLAIKK